MKLRKVFFLAVIGLGLAACLSWTVATINPQSAAFCGHTGRVFDVVVSPDGKSLASTSADGTIKLWDVATYCCKHLL